MAAPGRAKRPSAASGFAGGPNRLSSASSQVDQGLLFQRGSCFSLFPFLCSPLPSHYFIFYFFEPFIYRGQESFMGRWIPSDIMWWISIRRINSGFVWGINPHCTLIHRHQPGQYIIRGNFIMLFVCFKKEKGKEWKSELGPRFHEGLLRCCSVVFFYKHYLQSYLFFLWEDC